MLRGLPSLAPFERIGISTQLGHNEGHALRHQAGNECDVAGNPVELGNKDGTFGRACRAQSGGKLRPPIERVGPLAGFGLDELPGKSGARGETEFERGQYLVDAIMACDGCHTPRPGGGVLDMTKRFSGGSQTWDEPHFLVKGSNISSDRERGIGAWSDAYFKRLMSEGGRPNGVKVAPQMPFAFYKILTPRDLDAVTAYIRSVAPQSNQVQPPVYKAAMHYEDIPGGEKPFTDDALNDPSLCGCDDSGFVVTLIIAWSPVRRFNAG
jgi:hypothetical protein